MKGSVYIYTLPGFEYVRILLYKLCKLYGIEVTDNIENADYIFFSFSWYDGLVLLKQIYKQYGDKKIIIVGGHLAEIPAVRFYSHMVNVGEGYDFIKEFSKAKSLDDLYSLPYVATKDKPHSIKNRNIYWELNPIYKDPNKNFYYYFASRGCIRRCKFCFTSWSNKFMSCPISLLYKVFNKIPKNGNVALITTSWYHIKDILKYKEAKRKIVGGDVTVKDFLEEMYKYVKFTILRLGIEFFDEKMRYIMGKPISMYEIKKVFELAKSLRIPKLKLFFIKGLESKDKVYSFFDEFPECLDYTGYVSFKYTWITFQPSTPLNNFDVRRIYDFPSLDEIFSKILIHKLRLYSTIESSKATEITPKDLTYTFLNRCRNIDEVEFVLKLRNKRNKEEVFELIDKAGYNHLFGSEWFDTVFWAKRYLEKEQNSLYKNEKEVINENKEC